MRSVLLFGLLALVGMVALGGCAGANEPMSMDDFRDECRGTESELCPQDVQDQICNQYATTLSQDFASALECRRRCDHIVTEPMLGTGDFGCDKFLEKTSDWCYEYCDRNFSH